MVWDINTAITPPSEVPAVKSHFLPCFTLAIWLITSAASAAELPADYYKLLAAEVKALEGEADLKNNPGAMLSAAVLYTKQHPANPAFGDKKKLALAIKLGDVQAALAEKDTKEDKQDY